MQKKIFKSGLFSLAIILLFPCTAFFQDSIHDKFLNIAATAPEFAGYYYVGQIIHINVASEDPEVHQRVLSVLEAQEPLFRDENPIYVIDTVKYSFNQINSWYQQIYNIIYTVDGITGSGINELKNKITINVATNSDISKMEEVIQTFRVPNDAIEITVREAFHYDTEEAESSTKNLLLYLSLILVAIVLIFFGWRYFAPRPSKS
ncbi:MAG: hypothetical protein H6760_00800 [Candidatus Nomurabacteria bacterium]|nr:MAG: hypothetical protein H6760_00800 [Candidatus Nomurabacteria bacterium]